jgi:hypothetical protein
MPASPDRRAEAAAGLAVAWRDGVARIEWHHPDWLGPLALRVDGTAQRDPSFSEEAGEDDLGCHRRFEIAWPGLGRPIATSLRAYADLPLLVFRIEAVAAMDGLATGSFERPCVAWPWLRPDRREAGGVPEGTTAVGHLYTEFAIPSFSDASLARFPMLDYPPRPAIVEPLWIVAPDGRCLLLAPLDSFHDQVIAVPRGDANAEQGLACGWHGDLEAVPAGFASELAVLAGTSPRALLERWGGWLRRRSGLAARSRYADPVLSDLSYWTDNGAAYWYRTEPGLDLPTTLERTIARLRADDVPIRTIELDSWFYPHEKTRPLNPERELDVPPTGCIAWEPRGDVLPDGIGALRRRLGDPPLVLHGRHFSSRSPYFERHEAWVDGERAHPVDEQLLASLMAQASAWGAVQYEQDWLIESFLGVRALRAEPGRARAWQAGLDRAARELGLSLLWCMASPADFMQSATLSGVTAIRTSGDYRYLIGSAALWLWYLHTNALARALDLPAFKDVFLSSREGRGLDGDPHAEVEALLAVLGAGPVGLGDRLGRTDRELVLRTCRADGRLVKPDVPVAALDRCFASHSMLMPAPLVGETHSQHAAGTWTYVVALNVHMGGEHLSVDLSLEELGAYAPGGPLAVYDWRKRRLEPLASGAPLHFELAPLDWDFRVLCPVLEGGVVVLGDPQRYATAGDSRIGEVRTRAGRIDVEVLGAPGEAVCIEGLGPQGLRAEVAAGEKDDRLAAQPASLLAWEQAPDGHFRLKLRIPDRGRADVVLAI